MLSTFTTDWSRARDGSPDRVDAMAFALTELMLTLPAGSFFTEPCFLVRGEPVSAPGLCRVTAVIARSEAAAGGVAVVWVAFSRPAAQDFAAVAGCVPLTLLDYALVDDATANAGGWLAAVVERAREWQTVCDPRRLAEAAVVVEQRAMGPTWVAEGAARMLPLYVLGDEERWDWPAASQELKTAMALNPNDPFVLVMAGDQRMAIGQSAESLSLYDAALSTDPLLASLYQSAGWAYVSLGRFGEAERAMRRVLEISPTYGDAHHDLAVILLMEGRPQDALSEIQKETPVGGRAAGLVLVYQALHRNKEADTELTRLESRACGRYGDVDRRGARISWPE